MHFTPLDRYIRDYQLNKDNTNHIFVSNGGLQKVIDNLENEIVKALPHGSGIDCDWTTNRVNDLIFDCHNSYHAMDQDGYYCGYVDFIVRIDLLTKDIDLTVCQEDIDTILADYATEMTEDENEEYFDLDDPSPYLDDLGDYLYQTIDQAIELYYASESINYLVNDSYYRELVKRAIERVESKKD